MPRMQNTNLHDPRDFHIQDSKDNSITKEERDQMWELFVRRWIPFLSGAEVKICLFIYDRTIMYNKRWEYVSVDNLETGFPTKDYRDVIKRLRTERHKFLRTLSAQERAKIDNGEWLLTAPTGLSRRQIIRSLASLEQRQFIVRYITANRSYMALNPDAMWGYIDWAMLGKPST